MEESLVEYIRTVVGVVELHRAAVLILCGIHVNIHLIIGALLPAVGLGQKNSRECGEQQKQQAGKSHKYVSLLQKCAKRVQ